MNFNLVYSTANELYGIDKQPEELEEIALIAWNKIGNSRYRLMNTIARICPKTLSVELPCDAEFAMSDNDVKIESVTYCYEDSQEQTNINPFNVNSYIIETWIEGSKHHMSPFYSSGKYAKYQQNGRTLYFDKDYGTVHIKYKELITDNEGMPEISDKEAQAIATYIAYVEKQKEAWRTNNANLLQMSQYMYQQWLRQCDQARIPDNVSQNEMDQALNARTRWDRKIYEESYKPIL